MIRFGILCLAQFEVSLTVPVFVRCNMHTITMNRNAGDIGKFSLKNRILRGCEGEELQQR